MIVEVARSLPADEEDAAAAATIAGPSDEAIAPKEPHRRKRRAQMDSEEPLSLPRTKIAAMVAMEDHEEEPVPDVSDGDQGTGLNDAAEDVDFEHEGSGSDDEEDEEIEDISSDEEPEDDEDDASNFSSSSSDGSVKPAKRLSKGKGPAKEPPAQAKVEKAVAAKAKPAAKPKGAPRQTGQRRKKVPPPGTEFLPDSLAKWWVRVSAIWLQDADYLSFSRFPKYNQISSERNKDQFQVRHYIREVVLFY